MGVFLFLSRQEAYTSIPVKALAIVDSITIESDKFFLSEMMDKYDVFVPSCNARKPPIDENELNNHVTFFRQSSAGVFGHFYSNLFKANLDRCTERLPACLTMNGKRGCNRKKAAQVDDRRE